MYRNMLQIAHEQMAGLGDYKYLVLGVLGLLAAAVLLQLLPPWRRSVREAWAGRGWKAIVLALANGLLVLLVGAALVAALGAAMLHHSREFTRRHGSVTEANRGTIRSRYGPAREQRELQVGHTIEKEKKVLFFPETGKRIELKGAEPPASVGTEDGPILDIVTERVAVPQNSLTHVDVDIDVFTEYPAIRSAFYRCYRDKWRLAYRVRNRSDKETDATFTMPISGSGSYDELTIKVDGEAWPENILRTGSGYTWEMPMKPGQEVAVEVAFTSTGMEHVRYIPARMQRREQFNVTLRLHPVPQGAAGPRRILYRDLTPLYGGMRPTNRDALTTWEPEADGEPLVMEWDLSGGATALDMGVITPEVPQPGEYAGRLLHEAPLGLALLVGACAVTWFLLGRQEFLLSLAILAAAYFLFFTLTATLSEHIMSFAACFAIGAGATLLVSGLYVWLGWGGRYVSHQTMALMAAFTVYFPLAAIQGAYEDRSLMYQVLYWVLVAYGAMLTVAAVWRNRRREVAPAEPQT
jgi:hypothetical protein